MFRRRVFVHVSSGPACHTSPHAKYHRFAAPTAQSPRLTPNATHAPTALPGGTSTTPMSDSTPPGAGAFADFASDFGVSVDIRSSTPTTTGASSSSSSSSAAGAASAAADGDISITPSTRRSASQITNAKAIEASPEVPDTKRVRASLQYGSGGGSDATGAKAKAPNMSPSEASPPGLKGYEHRGGSGAVVKSMGMRKPPTVLPEGVARIFSAPRVLQSVPHESFHFMHTPLEFRANALDKHTQGLMEALSKKYGLSDIDPIGPTSQDTQVHVGRICCEGAEGKLNAKSVMLEGSLGLCNGRRIRLDLSRLGEYALFPGQIVAVEGNNAGDGAFIVRKLYEGAPAPLPAHTPQQLLDFRTATAGQPTVVWAAAGPYTTSDNMRYEPLADLFHNLLKAPVAPDVLVLMGPFVSVHHPVVKTGHIVEAAGEGEEEVSLTFEECFRLNIAEPILGFVLDNPEVKTTVVLAPSLDDAHHTFCFPQPAFAKNLFQYDLRYDDGDIDLVRDGRVVLLSNPAAFKVNDVTIALSTTDVVSDVVTEEISRSGARRVNRVQRGLQHVLSQRHMYPVFPASRSVPLDLARLKAAQLPEGGKLSPDILLLRSKLNHFIHNTFGVLCVNGGSLAKGSAGGMYTRIHIFPEDKLDASNKAPLTNEIVNRASIQVVRI